jgi:hypothetical protein
MPDCLGNASGLTIWSSSPDIDPSCPLDVVAREDFSSRVGCKRIGGSMLRFLIVFILLTSPAAAQIMTPDEGLLQQLVPESFPFEASALAAKVSLAEWNTTITYTITNRSGMNLYMGIAMGSVSIGSCNRATHASGGLQLLPGRGAIAYAIDLSVGPPQPIFAPAGARIGGNITVEGCDAPNPGYPTAPVTMMLMIGRTPSARAMTQYPVSASAPIRRFEH